MTPPVLHVEKMSTPVADANGRELRDYTYLYFCLLYTSELLAYVSVCLPSGNFANLVLFASAEGKDAWGQSERHSLAVRVLTPDYYAAVRLYNGELPGGIAASETLRLNLVKYYDYGSRPLWRAVRPLSLIHI